MLLDKNKYLVLKEFIGKNKGIHGSLIAKENSLNQKTVSNILKSLEKENILKFKTEGKNKIYSLNRDEIENKEILKIIEIEKKKDFLKKNMKFKSLFSKLEQISKGILIIFGSYAKGINKIGSDLDILIMGNIQDIDKLEESFGIEINVINMKKNKFDLKENFVKEIVRNHIVLKNVEDFVDLIW